MPEVAVDEKVIILTVKKQLNISEFTKEAFKNLPESSQSLVCTNYDYEGMVFAFRDPCDSKVYILTKEKIEKGTEIFLQRCLDGKWPDPILRDISALLELGNWDANTLDMCIQTCIFDEIIYG